MCECCHYVFTISRLSQPTDVAVWDTVIENGVTPTQIRQRSKWKKKKERKLYKCSVERFFPLLIVHQKLADLDKKIPLRRFFFLTKERLCLFYFIFFLSEKNTDERGWTFGQIVQCDFPWVEYKFLIHILKFLL